VAFVTIAASAGAEQPTVVEEILGILRKNGQISEQQYRDLKRRAEDEIEERVRQRMAPAAAKPAEVAPAAPPTEVAAKPAEKPVPEFKAYWKDGFRLETGDGNYELRIGGRIQLDGAMLASSPALQEEFEIDGFQSGVKFRRARIDLRGRIHKIFDFRFEYDFAQGTPRFADVYAGVSSVPYVQRIQVGHFKEPFGLEQLTSSNDITFMERGLLDAFDAARNTGVATMTRFADDRVTFSAGGFRNTDNFGDGFGGNSDYNLAARVTGLPLYADDGAMLLHLGLGYEHAFLHGQEIAFSRRPETNFGDQIVSTGDFLSNDYDLIRPEVALVAGPLSVQAEFTQSLVDAVEADDPAFWGWYGYASYFLTGEHRVYKPAEGKFGSLAPRRNFGFGEGSGWGAFEVGARFSQLNLSSGGIDGGRLADTTLGVNWYLNPNIRLMFNYVYADRRPLGSENVWQSRFQIAF
jgi:phosphate-selective porin OprO/OprP